MESVVDNLHREVPDQLRLKKNGELHNFYYLIENSGFNEEHDGEKMLKLCQTIQERLANECVLASSMEQISKLWTYRESITQSLLGDGYVYKYDVSLPLQYMDSMVQCVKGRLRNSGFQYSRLVGYGHIGDGNLHLNITSQAFNPQLLNVLEPFIYEKITREYHGSISAEHGIGLVKRKFNHYAKCPRVLKMAKDLKHMFDPKGILNPYKVLS